MLLLPVSNSPSRSGRLLHTPWGPSETLNHGRNRKDSIPDSAVRTRRERRWPTSVGSTRLTPFHQATHHSTHHSTQDGTLQPRRPCSTALFQNQPQNPRLGQATTMSHRHAAFARDTGGLVQYHGVVWWLPTIRDESRSQKPVPDPAQHFSHAMARSRPPRCPSRGNAKPARHATMERHGPNRQSASI